MRASPIIQPVDEVRALQLFALRDRVVEYNTVWRFRAEYLSTRALTAVPYEDSGYFAVDTARHLAGACNERGYASGMVIPLENQSRCCLHVSLLFGVFSALNDVDIVWEHFVLVEEQGRFAVLCDFLHNTMAADEKFIRGARQRTIDEAERAFLKDFVHDSDFDEREKNDLRSLVAYYRSLRCADATTPGTA